MKWVPGSLFGRTALLILAVLVLSQLGSVALFRYYNSRDFAVHLANLLAAQIQTVTASLDAFDRRDRRVYVERLQHSNYLRLRRGGDGDAPGTLAQDAIGRQLTTLLSARLGYQTELRLEPRRLWIRVHVANDTYWLMLPRPAHEHGLPWRWIMIGALMALLALGGAFALAWRINQPLRRLTAAAMLVGKGAAPAPLKEGGAAEIGAVSRAFNQMAADLRKLEADRSLLLAGVSHDLRTPLARLRLGIEMVVGQIKPEVHDGLVEDIEDIDAVVGQFIAYVRNDEGEAVMHDADLNQIVGAVAERCHRLGLQVATHLRPLSPLPLRPTAIQRMVTNLTDNALHYGGGAVEVETALEGGQVVLRVLDRGPGIAPERLATMPQPFARREPSRGGEGGTGLGLAIVQRIARLHGGELQLRNRSGGGLEAQVTLPTATA